MALVEYCRAVVLFFAFILILMWFTFLGLVALWGIQYMLSVMK